MPNMLDSRTDDELLVELGTRLRAKIAALHKEADGG